MKIAHASDIHAKRERWAEVCASLDVLEETASRAGVDLFALSGDLADGPLANTERDIFDALCGRIQRLAEIAPVALIEGTPSHDAPGSLEVFEKLKAAYPIRILRPGVAYYLDGFNGCVSPDYIEGQMKGILFGVPEPSKKWLLAGRETMGKDETDEAIKGALRALFLGLGAVRREHPELPCILLYHGDIAGSTNGAGYEVGSGIAISRDDLAAVGADYYALGHIHEPQQIPGLPAYYAGSAYPCTWGETHQAGFNLVSIEEFPGVKNPFGEDRPDHIEAQVNRIAFPHPRRSKVSTVAKDPVPLEAEGLVWVDVTATKDEAAGLDADEILARLLGHGALPGSRVTLNILPTETLRAGEIVEKKAFRDKVHVWAAASETPVTEAILARADELEREAAARGTAGQGAAIRIDRLRLRGAIGIWKKSRKDEIDIDFAGMGDGVVAFASPNGAGKTTILENLHPWPCMLTRDGALKDHFQLKDSARELWFTDERTGWAYKALINIRADIASGGAEYFLHVDKGQGWEPVQGINGRKEPYEAAIGQLFGSLELYLRTAFATQGPTKYAPDLSQATQGQRKALFVELSGIDYLDCFSKAARARGDDLEGEILRLQAAIEAAAGLDQEEAEADAGLRSAESARAAAAERKAAAETAGKALAIDLEGARKKVSEREAQVSRKGELRRQLDELAAGIQRDEAAVGQYQTAADGRDAAQARLDELAGLEAEAASLREQRDALTGKHTREMNAWGEASREAESRRGLVRVRLETSRKALATLEKGLAGIDAQLGAPVVDRCPTCGALLDEAKLAEIKDERARLEGEKARIGVQIADASAAVRTAEADLEAIITPPQPEEEEFSGAQRLRELLGVLAGENTAGLRATVMAAGEAAARIDGLKEAIESKRLASNTAEAALRDLGAAEELLANARDRMVAVEQAYNEASETYSAARADEAAQAAIIAQAQERLEAIAKKRSGIGEKRARYETVTAELAEWRLLERAAGPNGIQALELDALAPSIANISNKLLAEAYGSRYLIEFRTTRIAGKGKQTKQVEDFEIYILDAEDGSEQTIDSLSGGERVWILKALTDGFAIIRARNTGTRFQTAVFDEADGALDAESKMLYLRMLEAAHRESGRFQTILVTHSTEVQAMVEKTINVADLGPRAALAEGRAA